MNTGCQGNCSYKYDCLLKQNANWVSSPCFNFFVDLEKVDFEEGKRTANEGGSSLLFCHSITWLGLGKEKGIARLGNEGGIEGMN